MANQTISERPQHSLPQSFLLHILPGLLTLAGFFVLKPVSERLGYPPLLAFLLAVLLLDLPLQLGLLLREGKHRTGKWSLAGLHPYQEKLRWGTFALIFLLAFAALYLLISLAAPLSGIQTGSVFGWIPDWMILEEASQYAAYPRSILIIVFTLQLILTGVLLPVVEELYFRGFLLSRLSRFQWGAPIISGLFFALYHAWQPYSLVSIFLLGAGLSLVVFWKKNLNLSITLHVAANALARLGFLMAVLAA